MAHPNLRSCNAQTVYRGFNELQIEGSEIIRNLPDTNVLFISNHQTYFADVVAMFHVLMQA
jgi:1-acyl-sn-glycerol-3-phosphate acyltransferase